jgi:polygalacturonase
MGDRKNGRKRVAGAIVAAAAFCAPTFCARTWVWGDPPLPVIPAGTFNITNYGASVGNSAAANLAAIQSAILACNAAGGGTVVVPAGTFVCAPGIMVSSNTNFEVDGVLQAPGFSAYQVFGGINFLTFNHASNCELSGSGTIDGQAIFSTSAQDIEWWGNKAFGVPVYGSRPRLVEFSNCKTALATGVTVQNSPSFHFDLIGANNNVTFNGVTISAPSTSPNTDGIDYTGTNYLIEHCVISDGDDNICAKPETEFVGNIVVRDCTITYGHGISVGGQTMAGLNNLYVNNVTFNGATQGLRLKAAIGNGGNVNNVSFSHISMTNVKVPIEIDSFYAGGDKFPGDPTAAVAAGANTPTWNNISFSNITAVWDPNNQNDQGEYADSVGGWLWGLPQSPVSNMTFTNVKIGDSGMGASSPASGLQINHVRGMTFDSSSWVYCNSTSGSKDLVSTPPNWVAAPPPPPPPYANLNYVASVPYDSVITLAGFTNQDIGDPIIPANAANLTPCVYDPDSGQWTMQGDGAGIGGIINPKIVGGSQDEFNYSSCPSGMLGVVSTQVISVANGGEAGVMIRAGLDSNQPFVAVMTDANGQVTFVYRGETNGGITTVGSVSNVPVGPIYLQIAISGAGFEGAYGSDGVNWTRLGTTPNLQEITGSATLTTGLAASSNNNGSLAQAVFGKVNLDRGPIILPPIVAFNPLWWLVWGGPVALAVIGIIALLIASRTRSGGGGEESAAQ